MSIELNPSNQLSFHRKYSYISSMSHPKHPLTILSFLVSPAFLLSIGPLTRTVTESLILHNPNADPAIFKIKTTAPKAYCVRPNSGRVDAGSSVTVQVLLQPMAQEPPEDHKCKDKFLVQSALLPPSLAHLPPADIMSEINSTNPSQIHQAKLKCVYLPASREAEEPITQYQPVEERTPAEDKSGADTVPKSPKSVSEEDEVYENAYKRVEQIVPEPIESPLPVAAAEASPRAYKQPEPERSQQAVEKAPAIEKTPAIEKAPAIETAPATEKAPNVEKAIEKAPAIKKAPAVEKAIEKASIEKAPSTEQAKVLPDVAPAAPSINSIQEETKRYANENKVLRTNLQTANESILSMQKTIDSLKRELSAAQASVLTQRKSELTTPTANNSRKLASTVKPEDAVHQHLASLQVASPTEGYPPQVVAIIAFVVFVFTWLFF